MADDEKTYKILKESIEGWLSLVGSHSFTSDQLDKQFNIQTRKGKDYRFQALEYLVKQGKLEKLGTGKYRQVQDQLVEIDWQSANPEDVVELLLPLELQKYVRIYHKSINILAGSPGSGKTAFFYDLILRNMYYKMGIVLFTNDMTGEEIKERMNNSDFNIPNPPPFKIFDRADNFGDVVEPNMINVIDYLDLNSEVYLIGEEIERVYRKLDRGVAFIGIQKKPHQDIGIGGMFSSKRAKLYLSLDSVQENGEWIHQIKVPKARGRVDPIINPRSIELKFKLVRGIRFILC